MKYILFMLFLLSCSTQPEMIQKLSPKKLYKRDIIITFEGTTYEGTAVLPKRDKYDFHIESRGNLDLFTMTTCSKEESKERAWNIKKTVKSGLFGWGKKKIDLKREVRFTYYPTKDLEDDGDCTMELAGYEKLQGRHSWGFIDFEHPQYNETATVICNGRNYKSNGTTVCQARHGLYQRISFNDNMIVIPDAECMIDNTSGKIFEFIIKKGKCSYIFGNPKTKKYHKLTTIGYEGILIREN